MGVCQGWFVVVAGLAVGSGLAQADPAAVEKRTTGSADTREIGITVYNQNFGLVREVREVTLGSGRTELEYADVAAQIEPHTVHVKSLDAAGGLSVLEQNYQFDLLNPQKLLEKYVGKKVKAYRWNEKEGREDEVDAEVLSANGGTILKMGNEVTFNYPGRLAFPEIPANLIARPTLVWLLESARDKQRLEVSYLTQGMNWKADYVFVLGADDNLGDLTGWVTLTNQSGAAYKDARLKLVAGDVQRVQEQPVYRNEGFAMKAMAAAAPQFKEEGFFEYHLYTLERPTTLLDNETKQVTLLEAQGIAVQKKLQFYGAEQYYRNQSNGEVVSNQKVGVFLDIQNAEKNHLGMPLPKGIVRVYKADKSGAQQFIGEDQIDHTPRDERVRIKMGEAFDVVGDRKAMKWTAMGSCNSQSDWEINLRNHKDTATEIEVIEPAGGDWEIVSSSVPATRIDAHTFKFTVSVPARGEVKITYTVHVRWC